LFFDVNRILTPEMGSS